MMICGYSDQQSGTDRFGSTQLDMVGESLEVLNDGGEMELVACAGKSSEPHAFEAMMNFEMCKPHLDALALVA